MFFESRRINKILIKFLTELSSICEFEWQDHDKYKNISTNPGKLISMDPIWPPETKQIKPTLGFIDCNKENKSCPFRYENSKYNFCKKFP